MQLPLLPRPRSLFRNDLLIFRRKCTFFANISLTLHAKVIKVTNKVSAAHKNRTRDEIIAAFRESIRKKRLNEILAEFNETISILTNKPE